MEGTPHILSWWGNTEKIYNETLHTAHTFFMGPRLKEEFKNPYGWVGGWLGGWLVFFQEIFPLRGSILQAGTCKILRLAENPRWSRVWQWIFKVRLIWLVFVSETNKMGCLAKIMLYAFLHLTEFRVILGSRIVKKHIMYFPYVCNSFMHLVGYLKASGICWTFHIHPNTKEKHFFVQFGAPSYSLERWCYQNWAPCFFLFCL